MQPQILQINTDYFCYFKKKNPRNPYNPWLKVFFTLTKADFCAIIIVDCIIG